MRREGRRERMKVQTLPSDEHNTHNPLQLGADNRACPVGGAYCDCTAAVRGARWSNNFAFRQLHIHAQVPKLGAVEMSR